MINYAWGAGWPFRGTVALMMGLGTDEAFEFSITYDLPGLSEKPTLDSLWNAMAAASVEDKIVLTAYFQRDRACYTPICNKANQSIHVLWRQKLQDESMPQIPEDLKTPPIVIYGAKVEMKLREIENMRCGLKEMIHQLCGPEMTLVKITSREWAYNEVMGRPGEESRIRETVTLPQLEIDEGMKSAYNQELRDSAQCTQNVDKGFTRYLKYFKADQKVAALMQVSQGYQGEYGSGVYFQQGRHRPVLSGTVLGMPAEDALEDILWTACAEWASFQPRLGEPGIHKEAFYFTEDCTHFFELHLDSLHDLTGDPVYQNASPFGKEQIKEFCRGVQSFAQPFKPQPLEDQRALCYVNTAASSRRFQIAEGAPSFAPPASGAGIIQFGGRVFGGPGEAGTV
jgi:hypothetical protein